MDKIGSYGTYGYSIYQQNKTAKKAVESEKADAGEINAASKSGEKVTLSGDAKKLLKELKKTYGNMDFIVADYETDEEAAGYLTRGMGEYNVLLTPEELEKMAADEKYKKQNLQTLDDALAKLDGMKEQLGESGQDVKRIGIAIGDDGEISYFAELEKTNAKQRERIEKQRENRREETGEAVKRTTVYATSVEELLEKVKQVDWNAVREENDTPVGNHFDFKA